MILAWAIAACQGVDPDRVRALPDGLVDTSVADTDVDDTDVDDTDIADTDDTDVDPDAVLACYLGPDRGGDTCLPTVAYDPGFGAAYTYPDPYGGSAQYAAPARYLDLDAVDLATKLAPNFALSELVRPERGRWAVIQPHLLDGLQGVRDDVGGPVVVTSGYRNPAHNADVGGVSSSRHQYGDAADLDANGISVEALGALCEAWSASYVGLYEDGHTHCDWRNETLDPAFYASAGGPPPPPPRARLAPGPVWTAPATGFDEGEPLRRWRAWDRDGRLVANALGRTFVPPPGTTRVEVRVGGGTPLTANVEPSE